MGFDDHPLLLTSLLQGCTFTGSEGEQVLSSAVLGSELNGQAAVVSLQ